MAPRGNQHNTRGREQATGPIDMKLKLVSNREHPDSGQPGKIAPSCSSASAASGESETTESTESPTSHVEQLYRQYRGSLLRFLRNMLRSEDDALELLQETYIRILGQERVANEKSRAYLFQIALNLVRDKVRKDKARYQDQHIPLEETELLDDTQNPHDMLIWQTSADKIKRSLFELPPRCRKIFLLRRIRHLSSQEIANILGISKRTVDRELLNAITHCKRSIQE